MAKNAVKVPSIQGEILVQTITEPIVIDDDSDDEMAETSAQTVNAKTEQPPHQNATPESAQNKIEERAVGFDDDYEIGEPSKVPQPPRPPRPLSPISKVSYF